MVEDFIIVNNRGSKINIEKILDINVGCVQKCWIFFH